MKQALGILLAVVTAASVIRADDSVPSPRVSTFPGSWAQTNAIIDQGLGRWRVFAGSPSGNWGSELAAFSPDRRSFTVVFSRGVISRGASEYQIRLFRVADDGNWSESVLFTLDAPGDTPGIMQVRWINSGLLSFLGNSNGEVSQVYTLELASKRVTQRTQAEHSVISYDFSADGTTLVFATHTPPVRPVGERLAGMVPGPSDNGWNFSRPTDEGPDIDVHAVRPGNAGPQRLFRISSGGTVTPSALAHHGHAVRVSPDGKWAFVAPYFDKDVKEEWQRFTTEDVRLYLDSWRIPPAQYARIDLSTGAVLPSRIPTTGLSKIAMTWTPDSRRIIVSGYVPPEHSRFAEIDRSEGAILSLDIFSGELTVVAPGPATIATVDSANIQLVHEPGGRVSDAPRVLRFIGVEQTSSSWRQKSSVDLPLDALHKTSALSASDRYVVGITESADNPTEIAVVDLATQKARAVTELNPGLRTMARAVVEPRMDLAQSPDPWPARLVRPMGYVPGKRYPAVVMYMDRIGFVDGYVLDGPDYRATNPIQALASRGIAVLMVWFPRSYWPASGEEKRRRVREISDTAYDTLVKDLGLAEPGAVAATGFSHGGWVTEYGLQHSARPYAAAVAIDNFTGSYLQYIMLNSSPTFEEFYGGATPYDEAGRRIWWEEAVGFNPGKFRAPLLKEVHGNNNPVTAIAAWETYSGRYRYHLPTELVYYPEGIHVLQKVEEQRSSAARQVDWMCFWLKGEEDPEPAKAVQYARWRKMKIDLVQLKNEPTQSKPPAKPQ